MSDHEAHFTGAGILMPRRPRGLAPDPGALGRGTDTPRMASQGSESQPDVGLEQVFADPISHPAALTSKSQLFARASRGCKDLLGITNHQKCNPPRGQLPP